MNVVNVRIALDLRFANRPSKARFALFVSLIRRKTVLNMSAAKGIQEDTFVIALSYLIKNKRGIENPQKKK